MVWNVYRRAFNSKEIEITNVFDHGSFEKEVNELLEDKKINYEEFCKKLRLCAMYYFWSKYEYEVIVTEYPPRISNEELERINADGNKYSHDVYPTVAKKIDIYQQLDMNWDKFVDYVYSFKKN